MDAGSTATTTIKSATTTIRISGRMKRERCGGSSDELAAKHRNLGRKI